MVVKEPNQSYQVALILLPSFAVNSTKPIPSLRFRGVGVDFEAGFSLAETNKHGGFTSPVGNAGNLGAAQSPQFQMVPRGIQIM
jgi:hypothetical protein